MPYYPPEEESKAFFKNNSQEDKMVSDYTGLNFLQLDDLGIFDYWGYVHDAIVHKCNSTEAGREYLENAYYYAQDKPDRAGLSDLLSTRVVK